MSSILFVEDNPVEARAISAFIARAGLEVEISVNAEKGFQRLTDGGFDLLLSDLHLPGESGFALCRRVRSCRRLRRLPVALISRWADPLNILRGLEAGADGFISKDHRPADITRRLKRLLSKHGNRNRKESGLKRVVFLQNEFHLPTRPEQLLEVLLSGFEDAVILNEKYEKEIDARAMAQRSLRDFNVLYHSLIETLPLGLVRKDLDGAYIFANERFCTSVGRRRDQIVGKTDFDLYPPTLAEQHRADDRKAVDTGQLRDTLEEYQHPAGTKQYTRLRRAAVRNSRGEVIGTQTIFYDVTSLKLAEDEITAYAVELKRSNLDLEQLACIASRDLQEPLRMIGIHAESLAKACAGKLDAEAEKYLASIVDVGKRMQQLIDNLLMYSRVRRDADVLRQPVDLREVLRLVLANMEVALRETGGRVQLDRIATVLGSKSLLIRLFQKLISNALKFRGDREPIIQISCQTTGNDLQITVRDNGIGIDARHRACIFELFHRSNADADLPGIGISLAVCRKIVEYHGGRIWVESDLGEGTAVHFTLPTDLVPRLRTPEPCSCGSTLPEAVREHGHRALCFCNQPAERLNNGSPANGSAIAHVD